MRTAAAFALILVATGCAPRVVTPPFAREYQRVGPLEISAVVERDLADVLGSVDVMNTSADTVRLEYAGQCALAVLVYDRMAARPRWDSSHWWAARGECPAAPMTLDLPPRTLARVVAPLVEAYAILGDSLPLKTYQAALRLRLLQPRDTTLILPAGDLQLEVSRAPLLAGGAGQAYE